MHHVVLLTVGLAIFFLCLLPAWRWLPEWSAGKIPSASEIQRQVRQILAAGEIELGEDPPQLSLTTRAAERRVVHQFLHGETSDWLRREKRPFFIDAQAQATWHGSQPATFILGLGLDYRPWHSKWIPPDFEAAISRAISKEEQEKQAPGLAPFLLRPGEQLGETVQLFIGGAPLVMHSIDHSTVPETLLTLAQGRIREAIRAPATLDQGKKFRFHRNFGQAMLRNTPNIVLFLLTLVLLIRLGLSQRIDFKNAAILTVPILIATLIRGLQHRIAGWVFAIELLVPLVAGSLGFFLLWSVAESWHRTSRPGLFNNLDWLRRARVGPRAGQEILGGFALGGLLGGLLLVLPAIATALALNWGGQSTVQLPAGLLPTQGLWVGSFNAGKVLLLLALCFRSLPSKWVPAAAVVLSAVVLDGPFDFSWLGFASNLILATVLVVAHQRWNVTGLLSASIVGAILPVATFSALHLEWMSGTLTTSLVLFSVLLVAGFVGLGRPPEHEQQNSVAPTFVRRIEKQRRLRHEMDLLARMQRGLLPTSRPQVDGYQIAARSELATEAGGDLYHFHHQPGDALWIAAGDVAGHGYSCAIAQAMTKACLVSMLDDHSSPAAVLHKLDRVLRAGSVTRHFTSLVLLRLDPDTGRGVIANAGHPYPILISSQGHRELDLPSLPLGQGPERTYVNSDLQLDEGDALLFYSDGLYEATSPSGQPYGFSRPAEALSRLRIADASEMLEGLFTDWRCHLANIPASDDTTLVVLKRSRH